MKYIHSKTINFLEKLKIFLDKQYNKDIEEGESWGKSSDGAIFFSFKDSNKRDLITVERYGLHNNFKLVLSSLGEYTIDYESDRLFEIIDMIKEAIGKEEFYKLFISLYGKDKLKGLKDMYNELFIIDESHENNNYTTKKDKSTYILNELYYYFISNLYKLNTIYTYDEFLSIYKKQSIEEIVKYYTVSFNKKTLELKEKLYSILGEEIVNRIFIKNTEKIDTSSITSELEICSYIFGPSRIHTFEFNFEEPESSIQKLKNIFEIEWSFYEEIPFNL